MMAGKFRQPVLLQRRADGEDANGQPVQTWQTVANTWADIRFSKGVEAARADASVSVGSASIRLRYRDDVTADMRVVCGSSVFDIRAVLPDLAKKQFVDLVCETGKNDG